MTASPQRKHRGQGGRIRVLHLVYKFSTGGAEIGIQKIVRGLDPRRFEHVICSIASGYRTDLDLPARIVSLERPPERTGFLVPALAQLFRRERPDIVHSRNWGTIEGVLAARLAGVPAAVHAEHGRNLSELAGEPLRRRLFRRLSYSLADAVMTVSDEMRQHYSRTTGFPAEKIEVVLDGVDTARFARDEGARGRVRAELGAADSTLVVGTVARLDAVKDLGTLLRGVELAMERGVDCRVVIVGDGPERAELERRAAASVQLADKVRFTGTQDDVRPWLAAMDTFVLSSLFEGISVALLEAMLMGAVPVVTAVGGNTEVVEHGVNGLVFRPQAPTELAGKLECLTSVQLRASLAASAKSKIQAQYSLGRTLERYEKVYLSALGQADTCERPR